MNAPVTRLAAAVACGYVSIGAGIQVLPDTAHERFGAGTWATGAAVTAASLAAVFARPLAGRRADLHGPRGVVALGGALAAAGAFGQLLAPSLALLVLARLLIGAGEGALFTAAIAWVLATAPLERRGRIVGHFGLSMWGGLAAGPPLAAALAATASTEAVWWACALLPLPPAIAVLAARERGVAAVAASGAAAGAAVGRAATGVARGIAWRERAAGTRRALLPGGVGRPAVVLALASFGYGTLNAFLVLRFRDAGFGGAGVALGVFGVAFLLCRLVGSPLVDRLSASTVVAVCAVVEATGLVLAGLAPISAAAFAGIALCGFGTALVYPALATLVAGIVAPANRGAAVGALTSSWDAGIALAGPLGGVLGVRGPFVLAALAALAAAGVSATRTPRRSGAGAPSARAAARRARAAPPPASASGPCR